MRPAINIEMPQAPRLGSCGGDSFGGNSYASIEIDEKLWGFLIGYHVDADIFALRFTWAVQSSPVDRDNNDSLGEIYVYLGRRKNFATAHRAAMKAVRKFLEKNEK